MRKLWNNTIKPFCLVVIALAVFRSMIADWHDVPTGSMNPTIIEGDRIFVNKLAYGLKLPFTMTHVANWSQPRRGDIVVFYSPELRPRRLVKRVVAVPGDMVAMRDNQLWINGEPARYKPAPGRVTYPVEGREPGRHAFAMEEVDGRSHPVMSTPQNMARRDFGPIQVPAGKYFVLGDNRDSSRDSRFFGFVDGASITGRASAVAFSLDYVDDFLPRLDRFAVALE